MSAEEVPGCGPAAYRLGATDLPGAVEVADGLPGGDPRDLDLADVRVVGGGPLFGGVQAAVDGHLHVRLARAEPHLADEDVLEGERVLPRHGHGQRPAGLQRRQRDAPLAVIAGFRRHGRGVAELHFDPLPGIGPAPDLDVLLLLQNHVAAEDVRHPHIRMRTSSDEQNHQSANNVSQVSHVKSLQV